MTVLMPRYMTIRQIAELWGKQTRKPAHILERLMIEATKECHGRTYFTNIHLLLFAIRSELADQGWDINDTEEEALYRCLGQTPGLHTLSPDPIITRESLISREAFRVWCKQCNYPVPAFWRDHDINRNRLRKWFEFRFDITKLRDENCELASKELRLPLSSRSGEFYAVWGDMAPVDKKRRGRPPRPLSN